MIARKMGNSTTVLLVEKVEKGIGIRNPESGNWLECAVVASVY
jgi:hypothetical protein